MSQEGHAFSEMNLKYVLWRTRGYNWDYDFVLEPESPSSGGWYLIHRSVFGGVTPTMKPTYVRGTLVDTGAESVPFVGAAFLDPSRRDAHGRPVAHYVMWFRVGETFNEVLSGTPAGWEITFLKHVSEVFDSPDVFAASITSEESGFSPRAALNEGLETLHGLVKLTGQTIEDNVIHDVGNVKKNSNPSQKSTEFKQARTRRRMLLAAILLIVLLLVATLLYRLCPIEGEVQTPPQPTTQSG